MPDELIGLFPKEAPKDLGEPDPKYSSIKALSLPSTRDIGTAFFMALGICIIPMCIVIDTLGNRPAVVAAIAYTLSIFYILSDRFLKHVPWDLLNKHWKKFLSLHCVALIVAGSISSWAFAVKPQLPDWFTTGRKPLFLYCLGGVLLAMAFWECSYISKHKERPDES